MADTIIASATALENYGIIGFSYSLRSEKPDPEFLRKLGIKKRFGEPNPNNRRLAAEVFIAHEWIQERKEDEEKIITGLQWEIDLALPHINPDIVVFRHREKGPDGQPLYLDSVEVADQVTPVFLNHGVKNVMVIAKPGLHLWYCKGLMKKRGFGILNDKLRYKVNQVGSDPESDQWWTRSEMAALFYAVRKKFFGSVPKVETFRMDGPITDLQLHKLATEKEDK
jgi:hypothetical protein